LIKKYPVIGKRKTDYQLRIANKLKLTVTKREAVKVGLFLIDGY
jgi:hypothetical protein